MVTTISFVVGKGSIAHNNRSFIALNVVEERIELDEFYKQETLKEAYDKLFGQAIKDYNDGQDRKDRKIDDYITKIKNSKNNEKVFYENVVQVGCMKDFGVVDENGNVTENALKAKEVLDQYVKTFQERNPNLYLFNAVLHMDEATPHLHLDYIPVAHGYKRGMKTRNSLTRGLQEMGIEKATSKNDNETMHWQAREREYLTELCAERGIEIETIGIDRDDYTIPEYKAAMKAKEEAEADVEILKAEKNELLQVVQDANVSLVGVADNIREKEDELRKIEERLKAAEQQRQDSENKMLEITKDDKKVKAELDQISKQAVDVPSLFGGEQMVKLPKKSFKKLMSICYSVSKLKEWGSYLDSKLTEAKGKIDDLQESEKSLTEKISSIESFIKENGLVSALAEFLRPKSVLEKLHEYKAAIPQRERSPKKELKKSRGMER